MRILFRYVFREFLIPLSYCLIGFTGIYVLFELFGSFARISEAKLPFGTVVTYFAGYLSPFFHYLAPAALMLATLYTMWDFCRHSEITAMRASGISLLTIVKPLLLAAVLLAGFVAWVNESYMPDHALWAKRLRTAHFKPDEALRQGAPNFKDTRNHQSWVVSGEHNAACTHFTDVRITIDTPDRDRERVITARQADYLDGEWWLTDAKVIHYVKGRIKDGPEAYLSIASPTPDLDKLGLRVFPELRARPMDIQMQSDGAHYISSRGKLRFLRTSQDLTDDARRDFKYDAWAQIVSPLACVIITLLSIPAGISSGRQSVFAGVLGALGMFFCYYGLVIVCMTLAKTGYIPPVPAAFIPLGVFLALGVFFCLRPLRLTLILMGILFALFAVYVLLATGLTRRLGVDTPMAHTLAATLPLATAGFCCWRLRPR